MARQRMQAGQGETSKRPTIASAVGVNDLLAGDTGDGVLGNQVVLDNNGGVAALGDDDHAGAGRVGLGEEGNLQGNGIKGDVLRRATKTKCEKTWQQKHTMRIGSKEEGMTVEGAGGQHTTRTLSR